MFRGDVRWEGNVWTEAELTAKQLNIVQSDATSFNVSEVNPNAAKGE